MSTKKRLTYEELRTFPGFENHTDQMAEETIASHYQFYFMNFIKNLDLKRKD